MRVNLDEELDRVLKLDSDHPCYQKWKQYHLNDLVRGRQVCDFLSSRIALSKGYVLDIGSGLGGISIALSDISARVVGIEVNEEFVLFAERRARQMGRMN